MLENRHYNLEVIAGPCSYSPETAEQYYKMAEIQVSDGCGGRQPALWGTRVVGLKSRTELPINGGNGLGTDFNFLEQIVVLEQQPEGIPPSVAFAQELTHETGLLIATEIMMPEIQLPLYEGRIPAGKLLAWNPSVDQLGWHVWQTAQYAKKNGWYVGLKNGKWLDVDLATADNPDAVTLTSLQKAWQGLATFARDLNGRLILIHRGVDVPGKGDYRNAPIHEIARRAKITTGGRLYLDPSHMLGEEKRAKIVPYTIEAMHMSDDGDWLYNGILAEVGQSTTDTKQHITVDEFEELVKELAKFRRLRAP